MFDSNPKGNGSSKNFASGQIVGYPSGKRSERDNMAPPKKPPANPEHAARVKRIMSLYRADLHTRARMADLEFDRFLKLLADAGYSPPPLKSREERRLIWKLLEAVGRVEWTSGRHGRWVVTEGQVPSPDPAAVDQVASLPADQLELMLRAALAKNNEDR